MKLVIGLGNIGPQYARTRHNIGFMVVDQLARDLGATWSTQAKFKADVAEASLATGASLAAEAAPKPSHPQSYPNQPPSERIILAKPRTMMNLSGQAVQKLMQFYKLAPADLWVIFDDVDVPFGRLRLRHGGTSGQQGIRSITQHIGSDFTRVRLGISLNDRSIESSEVYVLKPFNPQESQNLPAVITNAAGIIKTELAKHQPDETTFDLLG